MKKIAFILFLIAGLFLIPLWTMQGMHESVNHGGESCIVATMQGSVCADVNAPGGMVAAHFNALRQLSVSHGDFSVVVLSIIFYSAVVFGWFLLRNGIRCNERFYTQQPPLFFGDTQRFLAWCALQHRCDSDGVR